MRRSTASDPFRRTCNARLWSLFSRAARFPETTRYHPKHVENRLPRILRAGAKQTEDFLLDRVGRDVEQGREGMTEHASNALQGFQIGVELAAEVPRQPRAGPIDAAGNFGLTYTRRGNPGLDAFAGDLI